MDNTGISLAMRPANERCRYIVTTSSIGWTHIIYLDWSLDNIEIFLIYIHHHQLYEWFTVFADVSYLMADVEAIFFV